MGMFDKYDNLNVNYTPDNSSPTPSVDFVTIDSVLPKLLYNINNEFIGYTWNHGEYFKFKILVGDMIEILKDSIIFNKPGEYPTNKLIGTRLGQQAYNTADAKSWTYTGELDGNCIWLEDKEVTYPTDGDKSIIINSDMTNSYAQLNICDFKYNNVLTIKSAIGEQNISMVVDDEMSELLKPGTYYCTLKIIGENECRVKNKFTIIIN